MSGKFVSEEIEHQIISLWLQGEKRDEIAVKTGISGGKVSNITAKFQSSLKAAGWSSDLVPYARATMRQMKSKGMGFNEIASALRINAIIEKHGISDEALPAIQRLTEAAKKENIDPSLLGKLLSAAKALFTAQRDAEGKCTRLYTPSDILKRIQELTQIIKLRKAEDAALTARVQQRTTNLASIETQIKKRESEFNKFNLADHRLAEHNISIDDIEKLSNMLENAKEHGMDAKGIVDTSSQTKSLKKALICEY